MPGPDGSFRFQHLSRLLLVTSLLLAAGAVKAEGHSPSMVVPETGEASGAWEATYGNQQDDSSFSQVEALTPRAAGGMLVAGWFWGSFEGLRSPNAYRGFLLAIDETGQRDWVSSFSLPNLGSGAAERQHLTMVAGPDDTAWIGLGVTPTTVHVGLTGVIQTLPYNTVHGRFFDDMLLSNDTSGNYVISTLDGQVRGEVVTSDLLANAGIQNAESTVLSDKQGAFIVGMFTPDRPFSNTDIFVLRLGPKGELLSRRVIDEDCALWHNKPALGPWEILMSLAGDCPDWKKRFLMVDRADGSHRYVNIDYSISGFCRTEDPKVLEAQTLGACPLGTTEMMEDFFDLDPRGIYTPSLTPGIFYTVGLISRQGSGSSDVPLIVRWSVEGARVLVASITVPFGLDPGVGNVVKTLMPQPSGRLAIGGSQNRTADVSTRSSRRSWLFSGAVQSRLFGGPPGAKPLAPRKASARLTSSGNWIVKWRPPASGKLEIRRYKVYRVNERGRLSTVAVVGHKARRYVFPFRSSDIGVVVTAVNRAGEGPPSARR